MIPIYWPLPRKQRGRRGDVPGLNEVLILMVLLTSTWSHPTGMQTDTQRHFGSTNNRMWSNLGACQALPCEYQFCHLQKRRRSHLGLVDGWASRMIMLAQPHPALVIVCLLKQACSSGSWGLVKVAQVSWGGLWQWEWVPGGGSKDLWWSVGFSSSVSQ